MLIELNVGNLIEPFSGRRWMPAEIDREIALRVGRLQTYDIN
jgi:hypothetical protein